VVIAPSVMIAPSGAPHGTPSGPAVGRRGVLSVSSPPLVDPSRTTSRSAVHGRRHTPLISS